MKKTFLMILVLIFLSGVSYAAREEALKDPRGNKSLLGDYNSETKRVVLDTNGYAIIGDISGGTQTSDVKITLDGEDVAVEGGVAEDAASTEPPVPIGGIAETTVPTAVADGDAIGEWYEAAKHGAGKLFNIQ